MGHRMTEKSLRLEIHSPELSRDLPSRVPRKALHGEISHSATKPRKEEGLLVKLLATMHCRTWRYCTCCRSLPREQPAAFFFFLILFIYLFLAALGLCCCVRASSSCCERGLLFLAVRGLLIAVASLVAEHGL